MNPRHFTARFCATLVFTFACAGAWAADGQLSLSTGFDYSSGDYGGSTSTDILSIPVIGKYETGPWTYKLTVPFIEVTGPGNVVPGVGRENAVKGKKGAAVSGTSTESGLGDITGAVTYNLFAGSASAPAIDLTGKIKLGTADRDKGLGTGENDYSVQVDAYQIFGRVTGFATLGYSILGSSSAIPLDNVFYVAIGAGYKFDDRLSGGLMLDLRQAASSTSGERRELTGYVNYKLDKDWKVQGYLLQGFADGSPDFGFGALVTRMF
ncbi:MAG: transporter [Betaproteobacteria bacterium]|nr:transporter [Betaproteobacteria bacterium]